MRFWSKWWKGKREGDSARGQNPLQEYDSTVETLYRRGVTLIHQNDWHTALPLFQEAVRLNPDSAPSWYALGLTYAKTIPSEAPEEDYRKLSWEMCNAFETAINLADHHGGLEPQQYHLACLSSGTVYRVERQFDRAIQLFQKSLVQVPEETEALACLVSAFLEKGDLAAAESHVTDLLKLDHNSETGRKLWKKIRKQAQKSLTSDLPVEEKKKIYSSFKGLIDDNLLLGSNLLENIQRSEGVNETLDAMSAAMKNSKEKAVQHVLEKYGVSTFELHLIIREGERHAWPVSSLAQFASKRETTLREHFRDSLSCVHCGKRNVAPFWPEQGDTVAFYNQTHESLKDRPGAFRLPIECAFCRQTWFVVWDQSPDPLAGQFIRHLERMSEAFADNIEARKAFQGMITDDLLGNHLNFIRKEGAEARERRQRLEHTVETENYFSILTIVPVSEPAAICRYLGNTYFGYFEPFFQKTDLSLKSLVHWIFAWGEENVGVHMLFLPNMSASSRVPKILPIDLLTPEERALAGI
jgi:tetratricopeptide (TPR) repeat protein